MKIVDEFTDRTDLSRSMKCLLRKRKAGKCRTSGCQGKPRQNGLCRECFIALHRKRKLQRPATRVYRCRAVRLMQEEE